MTDGRGRSRPERSLSIGANPAEESRHRLHGFLWPVVSVVAVGALIVGGVYGVPKLRSEPASETPSRVATAPDSAKGDAGLPTPSSNPPSAVGGALPPFGGAEGLGSVLGGNSGGIGDSGDEPGEQSTSRPSTPPPVQQDGPVPANRCPRRRETDSWQTSS